ncbi:MAG: hypothetical protein QOI15_2060 [Pseudonocardiales bacterium]|nr:hypothetical protein [Pseudonocardiales bacterium]
MTGTITYPQSARQAPAGRTRRYCATAGVAAVAAIVAAAVYSSGDAVTGGHGHALRLRTHISHTTESGLPPVTEQAQKYAGALSSPVTPLRQDDDEEVEHEENSSPTSTKQLIYHGGAVQTSPHIYLVLWGESWSTQAGDPNGLASRLHYFYQGVGGSSLANVLTEFSGSSGSFTNPADQYYGWLQDSSPVPAAPTTEDMAAAALRAASRIGDHTYNAQYVIATPWGVVDQYTEQQDACGWHNWTKDGSSWITYTSLPYLPYYATTGDHTCGSGTVTGSNLDGVTMVAAHEYEETVNDPGLDAWYDADGSENGDKCAWTNGKVITLTNGYEFPVQTAWSNKFRTQYGDGCLYTK